MVARSFVLVGDLGRQHWPRIASDGAGHAPLSKADDSRRTSDDAVGACGGGAAGANEPRPCGPTGPVWAPGVAAIAARRRRRYWAHDARNRTVSDVRRSRRWAARF